MTTLALPASSPLDRLRAADAPLSLQAAGVVGFTLLTALLAQFEIRIYLWEVPLTLQTIAVYSAGLYLGARNGFLALLLYLVLGLFLPFFSGGASGVEHLVGVTGGYLLAMPIVALMVGALTSVNRSVGRSFTSLLVGSVTLFLFGVMGLWLATDLQLLEALNRGWLRFIPWDLTKIALAGSLYLGLRKAFQG